MKRVLSLFWGVLLLTAVSCTTEESDSQIGGIVESVSGAVFHLYSAAYDDAATRGDALDEGDYDRVEFCVVDETGTVVPNIKGRYDVETSEIRIEGLHEGNYRLLVMGVRGDAEADGMSVHPINHADEEWISFPEDLHRPLVAEYFYTQTPFQVVKRSGASGSTEEVLLAGNTLLRRIVGRVDCSLEFHNPYVEMASVESSVELESCRFYTGFTGLGELTGESDGEIDVLDLDRETSWYFLPTVEGERLRGEISLRTRSYYGADVARNYTFDLRAVESNRIAQVRTPVVHPDDNSVTLFLTENAYEKSRHTLILQDDEPKSVYTDPTQRKFNTASPLQISVTDVGELHVRFYSPRDLNRVLIRASLPGIGGEAVDVAYFDRIPAFADFYAALPFAERSGVARSESGRWVTVPQLDVAALDGIQFSIESDDPYWEKLCAIQHGWTISFSLYGGNPDKSDGGPVGNWMGIRPVHCREAVAFFLNFTYMIDMPEHEVILRENQDRLYGNGGTNDKVTPETVLRQMRQSRSLNVGLVYAGHGVVGLGGGSTYGVYQQAWLQHYTNTYSCEVMFHELGHVMGYTHSSSFTYGPWAQQLMNHFYVDHLAEMPIDSPSYLNSSSNSHLY